jgi:hypothetical protein
MTEQEIAEFLEANKQDIQQEVRRRLVEGLVSNHRWEISAQIAAAVDVFVKEQIVPRQGRRHRNRQHPREDDDRESRQKYGGLQLSRVGQGPLLLTPPPSSINHPLYLGT